VKSQNPISRRGFLKSTGIALAGGGVAATPAFGPGPRQQQVQQPRIRDYRTLGRTGFDVSDIGFGTGNLTNTNVLEVALDMGVNYIDTGEHYVNGQAERTIGQAIKNRNRSSLFITTKLNLTFGGATTDEIKRRFQRCLERLQTEYVDCLMIHMAPRAEQVKHEGFHSAVEQLKAEGRVRFLGLSNHGRQHSWWGRADHAMDDVIGAAVEDGRFDVALFVHNFLQREQGERIITACKSRDMGVTLMKTDPVNLYESISGTIAGWRESGREVPESRRQLARDYQSFVEQAEQFKRQHGVESATDARAAATKFVLGNPDVHSVCATINTFDALESFVAISGEKLADSDSSMLDDYEALLGRYYCRHACGICEVDCPRGVPINTIMRYNHYFEAQQREKHAMQKYAGLAAAQADTCGACDGDCEAACPYGVPIRALLALAHRNLTLV